MKTYPEMNEKITGILRLGNKVEQYAAQYIEELRKENAELKHRAEVAERALELMARGECTFCSPDYYIEQAEKELSEE